MTMIQKIRHQLKELGFQRDLKQEVESLGVQLTVCQMIVVFLSICSIVFMFVPLFYLQDLRFMALFLGLSFVCMIAGIWFWVKQAEICEHPEDYQE